jgi:hypothetical protein
MNGTKIMKERPKMGEHGKAGTVVDMYCGAVLGSTILITAALPTASLMCAMTATISTVFVLSARLGGLSSPLPSSPLALWCRYAARIFFEKC